MLSSMPEVTMENLKNWFSFNKIFHFLSWLILVGSSALIFTKYKVVYNRFLGSLIYLKEAAVNWFRYFFLRKESTLQEGFTYLDLIDLLPFSSNELLNKFDNFFVSFVKFETFSNYCFDFAYYSVLYLLYALMFVVYFILFITIVSCFISSPVSNDMRGKKTNSVKFFNKYIEMPIKYIYNHIIDFILLFRSKWYYKFPFILIWLLNFNVLAIGVEALAWILAFPTAPTAQSILFSTSKLILDVILIFVTSPTIVVLIIISVILIIHFKKIAYMILNSKLEHDIEILESASPGVMLAGPQGVGKTKVNAFFQRLIEIIFHRDLKKTLIKFQNEYPDFPFILFEDEIKEKKINGELKGLYSVRHFVKRKKEVFEATSDNTILYDYSGPIEFDDSYKFVSIFEMLEQYAQAYFIYIEPSALAATNFPVRFDSYLDDIGNFPLWNDDPLHRTPSDFENYSHYSHILDQDSLRYGNHMDKENNNIGSFEFGSIGFTEKDKERGNRITNSRFDVNSDEANPLNDYLSLGMKMRRHSCNIDYKAYWRDTADLQRTSSLNADELELYDLLQIIKKSGVKLALPFFFLFDWIFNFLDYYYKDFIDETRYYGTEFTLPSYLIRKAFSKIFVFRLRIYNTYGYEKVKISYNEACQHDKEPLEKVLYIVYKLAHAHIYQSDTLVNFFDVVASNSNSGLSGYPTYSSIKPTMEELDKQHSYFNDLLFKVLQRQDDSSAQ